jgi:hypothetical protein
MGFKNLQSSLVYLGLLGSSTSWILGGSDFLNCEWTKKAELKRAKRSTDGLAVLCCRCIPRGGFNFRFYTLAVVALIFVGMTGCQTYSVEIVTNPADAEVYIYDQEKATYKLAGKTPFNLNTNQKMLDLVQGADALAISIEKKGYVVERLLLDHSQAPKAAFTFNLKKIEDWSMGPQVAGGKDLKPEAIEELLRESQRVSQQIRKRDLEVAYTGIMAMISRYPQVAILWEMKGSVELLRNQKMEAVKSFKQSLALGSKSPETKVAIQKLEALKQ